jgi:hypothetical protein
MGATSVRLIVNFKPVAAILALAALLLTGFTATSGFGPLGHKYGADRAPRQATELVVPTTPRPTTLAPSSAEAPLPEPMLAPVAGHAGEEVRALPRKFADVSKRRGHRFYINSTLTSAAIGAVSHQGGSQTEPVAHLQQDDLSRFADLTAHVAETTPIETVAVVEFSNQNDEALDRLALQEPVFQHETLTVSVSDNPTEFHPLSSRELAAVSAADAAVDVGSRTPAT